MKLYLPLLLLASIFLSPLCLAPPFSFRDDENLNLRPKTFIRFVHPQLKSINQNFYSLLKILDLRYHTLVEGRTVVLSLSPDSFSLEELHAQVLHLESIVNSLKKPKKSSPSITLEDPFALNVLHLHKKITELLSQIQRILFMYPDMVNSDKKQKENQLSLAISRLQISYHKLFLSPLKKEIRKITAEFYHSFILPTEKHILQEESKEKARQYFLKHSETLNFSWNNFYMKISKGRSRQSPKALTIGKTIHRRWSNILKIIMHP